MRDSRLSCPSCGAEFDVTGWEPGAKFACGACGNILQVPGRPPRPGSAVARRSGPAGRQPAESPAKRWEARRRSSRRSTVTFAIVGAGALAIAVGLFILLTAPDDGDKASYVIGYKTAQFLTRAGNTLEDSVRAIRKMDKLTSEFNEEYYRDGWRDRMANRDPRWTTADVDPDIVRK